MKKTIIIFLLILLNFYSYGQVQVSGYIRNVLTNEPIEDVSVSSQKSGAISNEEGFFMLEIDMLPASIQISHIAYKKITINVSTLADLDIKLQPAIYQLNETIVSNSASQIVNKALERAVKDSATVYSQKAYYQKTSYYGNRLTTFHEIIFDGLWLQTGYRKWKPLLARYGRVENIPFNFQNTSSAVFSNTGTLIPNLIMPNSILKNRYEFVFEIQGYINIGTEDEIVEIKCSPLNKQKSYFEGNIFVKTMNYNICQLKGTIFSPDPIPKKLTQARMTIDVVFQESSNGYPVFSYMNFNETVKSRSKNVQEKVKLVAFDQLENGESSDFKSVYIASDLALIKKTHYDPNEWGRYKGFIYSTDQKKLIESFERIKAFEN